MQTDTDSRTKTNKCSNCGALFRFIEIATFNAEAWRIKLRKLVELIETKGMEMLSLIMSLLGNELIIY